MKNNYETLDQKLDRIHGKKKNIKPVKAQKIKKVKPKKEKTKKSKKFIIVMVSLITAGAIALGSGVAVLVNYFRKKNNNEDLKTPNNSIVQIDDMGTELEFPKEETKTKYENPTGKADLNKIVEKNNKVYVDKESADKSNTVGTSSFDNKNNTLIEEDGKIKEKTEGYEIKDDKGSVIQKGELDENNIPEGYAWDSVLKKYVPKEEVGKYVYADATYYDEEGNVAIKKGDVVAKETLENAKKYLTTTKKTSSSSNTTTSSTTTSSTTNTSSSSKEETSSTTTTSNEGKINADGTYTIFGLTFESKADYEQWVLQGYEGYAEADGIMMPEEEILKQIQKTK